MTPRAHVLDRIEQSQIAAALAASCQTSPLAPPLPPTFASTTQSPALPDPTATKYGDLGSGVLPTTTVEGTDVSDETASRRTNSHDRLALSSLQPGSMEASVQAQGQPIVPTDPTARPAQPTTTRLPRRMLLDPSEASDPVRSYSVKSRPGPITDPFNVSLFAGGEDSIMQDDTAEVIGDSDGEGASSFVPIGRPARPAPAVPRRNSSVASSSIVDQTTSSAVPGPSKPSKASRSSDPIILTITTPSSRTSSGPTSVATKAAGFELVIDPAKSSKRTGSSSSSVAKGKARAPVQVSTSTAEDSSMLDARGSLKDRRSKTIAHDSPEPEVPERGQDAPSSSPDELLLDPKVLSSSTAQPSKKRKQSAGTHLDDASSEILASAVEETAAAVPSKGSKQGSRANSRTAAVSEDEDGRTAAQREAQRVNERLEEEDDDYGVSGKRKKAKKPKAQPKKRAAAAAAQAAPASIASENGADTGREASVEVAPVKSKAPRRVPTVPKAGAPESSTAAAQVTSPEQPTSARPKRQRKERTSSAYVYESPLKSNAKSAAPILAVPETQAQEQEQGQGQEQASNDHIGELVPKANKAGKQASKRKGPAIVHDSEEDDDVDPAEGAALTGAPAAGADVLEEDGTGAEAQPLAKDKRDPPRRNKSNQRKRVVASPDAEDEGAASDATSAIQTGDEFPDDDDKPVGGGKKGKGEAAARAKAVSVEATKTGKRPRLSTSPSRANGRSTSTESRIEQMMKAAATDTDESLLMASSKKGTVARTNSRLAIDDDEEEKDPEPTPSSPDEEMKENDDAAVRNLGKTATGNGTPAQQRGRSNSATPFSKQPRPGSLAAIMAKKGLATFRAPGLSARQRVPPLHTNLKPPPPVKKALPEKKVKKKKGDESYSDEEKPWYKRKDPEEWDDEDHRRWQKRQRRIEQGLPVDDDD